METQRLVLRPLCSADAGRFAELCAEESFMRFGWGRGFRESEALELLARWVSVWETEGFGMWAAVDRGSGATVGYVGLSVPTWLPEVLPAVEVGWRFAPASRGKGLATEGAVAALDFGFGTLGLDSVISVTQPGNSASWRVMERLGMRMDRRLMHPSANVSLVVYEITAGAWQDHRAQMGS